MASLAAADTLIFLGRCDASLSTRDILHGGLCGCDGDNRVRRPLGGDGDNRVGMTFDDAIWPRFLARMSWRACVWAEEAV